MNLSGDGSQETESESITELLKKATDGNPEAKSRLIVRVYDELRHLAAYHLRAEHPGHTLQPTALVHEAFMRLAQQPNANWQDRAHFFAVASQSMRRILVDHARARRAEKRGGDADRVTFTEGIAGFEERTLDVLTVHEALNRLEKLNARQSRIVELRFFGGLSLEEVAVVLDVSERTIKRDWAFARAWLHSQLG